MRSKLRVIPCLILLLPLDLIVAIGILLAQLPSLFGRGRRALGAPGEGHRSNQILRPSPFPEASPYRARASRPLPEGEGNLLATIVILNFDGKHLLAECLPAVSEAVKYAGGKHEVLVVDNGSADGSVQFVQDNFPEVRILALVTTTQPTASTPTSSFSSTTIWSSIADFCSHC